MKFKPIEKKIVKIFVYTSKTDDNRTKAEDIQNISKLLWDISCHPGILEINDFMKLCVGINYSKLEEFDDEIIDTTKYSELKKLENEKNKK